MHDDPGDGVLKKVDSAAGHADFCGGDDEAWRHDSKFPQA